LTSNKIKCEGQWWIPTRRLGGSQIGGRGRQEGLHLLKYQVCLRITLGVTETWLSFIGQKVAIFVGQTMPFFRENHTLKALCIINSEKVWNEPQTVGLVFHKVHRSHISTYCI